MFEFALWNENEITDVTQGVSKEFESEMIKASFLLVGFHFVSLSRRFFFKKTFTLNNTFAKKLEY
jgi:hypothetical protein